MGGEVHVTYQVCQRAKESKLQSQSQACGLQKCIFNVCSKVILHIPQLTCYDTLSMIIILPAPSTRVCFQWQEVMLVMILTFADKGWQKGNRTVQCKNI